MALHIWLTVLSGCGTKDISQSTDLTILIGISLTIELTTLEKLVGNVILGILAMEKETHQGSKESVGTEQLINGYLKL